VFHRELARAYLSAGRFADAERHAREALRQVANLPDPAADEILAFSLMAQNEPGEAGTVLDRGLSTFPGSSGLLLLRAFNFLASGDPQAAEREAEEMLERGPAVAGAHVALAYALGEQGRFDEAATQAERALAMSSDRDHRALLSWILIAGEIDVDRGLELAREAIATPSFDEASRELACLALPEHCLGMAYLKRGQYEEAVDVLTEAARLRPGQRDIRDHLERASELSVKPRS